MVAVEAGADAIGLVFYQPSSRAVSLTQAAKICSVMPAFVSIVALTVDATPALMQAITSELPIDSISWSRIA